MPAIRKCVVEACTWTENDQFFFKKCFQRNVGHAVSTSFKTVADETEFVFRFRQCGVCLKCTLNGQMKRNETENVQNYAFFQEKYLLIIITDKTEPTHFSTEFNQFIYGINFTRKFNYQLLTFESIKLSKSY